MTLAERIMFLLRSPADNEYAAERDSLRAEEPPWTPGELAYADEVASESTREQWAAL